MVSLTGQREGCHCRIRHLYGSDRFIIRIASMGLIVGTNIEIIQNREHYPLLLYARDTIIAIGRKEADNILVEEV
ncbi:MAG: FeoA family protein [Sporomusa sp.]